MVDTYFVICNFTVLKLKPSFLFRQKGGDDMECPSAYMLLLLDNEQSCLGQWLSRVKPGGKSEQRHGERMGRVRETPFS